MDITILLNKYGGKVVNKKILSQIIEDVKNEDIINKTKKSSKLVLNDKVIDETIDNLKNVATGEKLSENTIKIYKQQVNQINLLKVLLNLIEYKNDKTKINNIIKYIEQQSYKEIRIKFKKQNSINIFNLIIRMIDNIENLRENLNDYVINRIKKEIKELTKDRQDDIDDKKSFDVLKIKWTDYVKQVDKLTESFNKNFKLDKIDEDGFKQLQNIIVLNLYKFYTLRDDYGLVKLLNKDLDEDSNENYINVETGIFHLNKYKSSVLRVFGKKKYKIPQYIMNLIKILYNNNYQYLYSISDRLPYKTGGISKQIQRLLSSIFGETITINDLRKSHTTYFSENKSVKQQRQLAEQMLHTYDVSQNYYVRNELNKKK